MNKERNEEEEKKKEKLKKGIEIMVGPDWTTLVFADSFSRFFCRGFENRLHSSLLLKK